MTIDNLSAIVTTISGGFFIGVLIGYALKKVIKLVSMVVGAFFPGLVHLQYQQVASINWDKLQSISEVALVTLANATTQIPLGAAGSGSSGQTITTAVTNWYSAHG
jgi:uncharacterized membrane protein (Fun14 family)